MFSSVCLYAQDKQQLIVESELYELELSTEDVEALQKQAEEVKTLKDFHRISKILSSRYFSEGDLLKIYTKISYKEMGKILFFQRQNVVSIPQKLPKEVNYSQNANVSEHSINLIRLRTHMYQALLAYDNWLLARVNNEGAAAESYWEERVVEISEQIRTVIEISYADGRLKKPTVEYLESVYRPIFEVLVKSFVLQADIGNKEMRREIFEKGLESSLKRIKQEEWGLARKQLRGQYKNTAIGVLIPAAWGKIITHIIHLFRDPRYFSHYVDREVFQSGKALRVRSYPRVLHKAVMNVFSQTKQCRALFSSAN